MATLSDLDLPTVTINPVSGEVTDLADPARAAEFLDYLRMLKVELEKATAAAERVVLGQMAAAGSGTIHAGRYTLQRKTRRYYDWDDQKLFDLLEAGLGQDRFDQLLQMKVTSKVDRRVADSISKANPDYKAIIDAACTLRGEDNHVDVRHV